MANLSDLIAQSTSDNPQKLVNLALATQMMGSGSGLGGTNYVFVRGNGTPEENAAELQAAYNKAKTMLPSSGNIVTVVVAPGTYTFGGTKFPVNTPYINIVSLTGNADVLLDGIDVTANSIYLKGINCGTYSFTIRHNLNELICENCTGGSYSFGGGGETTPGTFINCTGGNRSFGYNNASGTFINCTGGNNSFGGSMGGTASGTFKDCTGGNYSFGGGEMCNISSTARLYYCRLTSGSFNTPETGGKLVLCIDGNDTVVTAP